MAFMALFAAPLCWRMYTERLVLKARGGGLDISCQITEEVEVDEQFVGCLRPLLGQTKHSAQGVTFALAISVC